jgi:NAD(P)-dependent dehydrogenase (short-subunit alcohol dehydrogenase family)
MNIDNRTILITGAAQRVGRIIALTLAERGAHIAFTYLDDSEPWRQTLAEIKALGVQALALPLNVLHPEQPKQVVDQVVERFGRLDVLLNNASVWLSDPFLDISYDAWRAALDVNLTGPFLCAQAAAPHMLARGEGVILNITDLSAFEPWPNFIAHSVSKAAIMALTRQLALELAPTVRVNAVAPGPVLPPTDYSPERIARTADKTLLGRWGTPQDVAEAVLYFVRADYVTGNILFIDGGERFGHRKHEAG